MVVLSYQWIGKFSGTGYFPNLLLLPAGRRNVFSHFPPRSNSPNFPAMVANGLGHCLRTADGRVEMRGM